MDLVSCAPFLSGVSYLVGALDTVIAGMGALVPAALLTMCIIGASSLVLLWSLVVVRRGRIERGFAQTRCGSPDSGMGRALRDESLK